MTDPSPDLTEQEEGAAAQLKEEVGGTSARAAALVSSLIATYQKEALGILLGTWQISGSVADQQLIRLDALIDALGDRDEPPPTHYELSALFRITPQQAQNRLKTYQARYGRKLQQKLLLQLKAGRAKRRGTKWVVQFADRATLDFAEDQLRRLGVEQNLIIDPAALTAAFPKEGNESVVKMFTVGP